MDVALDANLILNDPRMEGNAFRSLLDYLRKTNSRLVLSKVVMDEVIARYPERLRPAHHKTIAPIRALKNLVFDAEINIPTIDLERETNRLKEKLLKPSEHVKSLILDDFSDISVEEVARRGIQRMPPASGAGEELRDVIHWLMVLAHTRGSKKEIAFITADGHFQHEGDLHPRLQMEVAENKSRLHFYPSLDDFIKAQAPPPRNLSEDDAFALYGRSQVGDRFEIEARKFFQSLWPTASSVQVIGRDVLLTRGAVYDVAPQSQFGELEFSGEIRVRVTEILFTPNNYNVPDISWGPATIMSDMGSPYMSGSAFNLHAGSLIDPTGQNFPGGTNFTLSDLAGKGSSLPTVSAGLTLTSPDVIEIASEFHARGVIVISLRVVSGSVTNIETEKFELGKFEKSG